ncbi:MAG TPA: M23 family metallopeptidase [Bryobacteraceae bacterium]|nr:M23 family metallopeptidase [Bryobacteraceae bacterium]
MRKVLLIVWALVLTAGAAFYFGRQSALPTRATGPVDPGVGAYPVAQSRARIRESDLPKPLPEPPPIAASAGDIASTVVDSRELMERHLILPIAGLRVSDIQDTFNQTRDGTRKHEASDILAPRGTPVLAMDNGVIQKLFTSKPGGLTIYEFDNAGRYCYYYAHLDRYVEGLTEGMHVKQGDRVGYVGTTGNANPNTPHLHLAIFLLGMDRKWWEGTPINPYPVLLKAFPSQ